MAFLLPGAAHVLSGHWKTGIAWYFISFGMWALCVFILSLPIPLTFTAIIAVELLIVIYFVVLFVSSYRHTRRLGCGGWILFLLLISSVNITVTNLLLLQVRTYIGGYWYVASSSMHPTIKSMPPHWQNRIMTSSLSYRSSDPCRGDIVFLCNKDDFPWIKRVVGLPGETIDIRSPYVLVNGEKLLDPPVFAKISSCEEEYSGYLDVQGSGQKGITLPITLGDNEYFLLGDNSAQSWDSRHFGPVPRDAIIGRVTRIVFPPWRIREL